MDSRQHLPSSVVISADKIGVRQGESKHDQKGAAVPNAPHGAEEWPSAEQKLARVGGLGAKESGRAVIARMARIKLSTGSGGVLSARPVHAELKRICPKGGKPGGRRQARRPSQTARASPCCVARRAQS
jgi:hypothetical protein